MKKIPVSLNNILRERYSQDVSSILLERVGPTRTKPENTGPDPDIERGQFNTQDPELQKIRDRFASEQTPTFYAPITSTSEPLTSTIDDLPSSGMGGKGPDIGGGGGPKKGTPKSPRTGRTYEPRAVEPRPIGQRLGSSLSDAIGRAEKNLRMSLFPQEYNLKLVGDGFPEQPNYGERISFRGEAPFSKKPSQSPTKVPTNTSTARQLASAFGKGAFYGGLGFVAGAEPSRIAAEAIESITPSYVPRDPTFNLTPASFAGAYGAGGLAGGGAVGAVEGTAAATARMLAGAGAREAGKQLLGRTVLGAVAPFTGPLGLALGVGIPLGYTIYSAYSALEPEMRRQYEEAKYQNEQLKKYGAEPLDVPYDWYFGTGEPTQSKINQMAPPKSWSKK
jgi:hypothetical protein